MHTTGCGVDLGGAGTEILNSALQARTVVNAQCVKYSYSLVGAKYALHVHAARRLANAQFLAQCMKHSRTLVGANMLLAPTEDRNVFSAMHEVRYSCNYCLLKLFLRTIFFLRLAFSKLMEL